MISTPTSPSILKMSSRLSSRVTSYNPSPKSSKPRHGAVLKRQGNVPKFAAYYPLHLGYPPQFVEAPGKSSSAFTSSSLLEKFVHDTQLKCRPLALDRLSTGLSLATVFHRPRHRGRGRRSQGPRFYGYPGPPGAWGRLRFCFQGSG